MSRHEIAFSDAFCSLRIEYVRRARTNPRHKIVDVNESVWHMRCSGTQSKVERTTSYYRRILVDAHVCEFLSRLYGLDTMRAWQVCRRDRN